MQFGDDVTLGSCGGELSRSSTRTMATDWDEEELARSTNVYDGPQPYNFEPN